MAGNGDIVELSSDEEIEEKPRKVIGWNYQLNPDKDMSKDVKFNGKNRARRESDDIEVIDVRESPFARKPMMIKDSPFARKPIVAHPSTRMEIRATCRNTSQSSLKNYFMPVKPVVKNEGINPGVRKEDRKPETQKEEYTRPEKEKERTPNEGDKASLCKSEDSAGAMDRFIERWFEVKLSKDDDKIKDKLWKNYYLAHTSFTHSAKFISMCDNYANRLSVDNVYVMIKELIDCLKRYKDRPYKAKEAKVDSIENPQESEETLSEEERKRQKKLRKIDKKMKQIGEKIKECEAQEVDLDDEDNSVYLVEDRLKRQFNRLHDYYCKLAQCSPATGRPVERKFRYDGSRYSEINKRISAWVNKHKIFPDYSDVLNLVKRVTRQSSLPLRPETVRVQAQEIFRDVGRMLKERRQSDDLYSIYAYVPETKEEEIEKDPASDNTDLNQQLLENEKVAREKTEKIFEHFVNKEAEERAAIDQAKKDGKASKDSEDVEGKQKEADATTAEPQDESKSESSPKLEGNEDDEEDGEEEEDEENNDENNDEDEEDEDEEEEGEEDIEDSEVAASREEEGQSNDASNLQEDLSDDEDIEKVLQIPADEEEEDDEDGEDFEEDVPIVDVNGFSHDMDSNQVDMSEDTGNASLDANQVDMSEDTGNASLDANQVDMSEDKGNSSLDLFPDLEEGLPDLEEGLPDPKEGSKSKRVLESESLPPAKRIHIPLCKEDSPEIVDLD